MKTFNFYFKVFLVSGIMLIFSCSENSMEENLEEDQVVQNNPPLPRFPNKDVEILGHFNENGAIDGYYYFDDPTTIYPLGNMDLKMKNKNMISSQIISLTGDQDNFGYGGTSAPPCRFFDLSEPQDDLGNFDRLIHGPVDAEKSWTHDFREDPIFCSDFIAEEVTIKIREYFNDNLETIRILIDGVELNFAQNGISKCQYPIIQNFSFTGSEAAFANDGFINISVIENGEEVALDYSLVIVKGYCNTIRIAGCDTGVVNQELENDNTMQEAILALAEDSKNHGFFVKAVSALTNEWKEAGLISGDEKGLIMKCVSNSNNGK